MRVPANQTVSFTVYSQAIGIESRLPHDFLTAQMKRIERGFDHGEPISMIVEELKLVHSLTATYGPTKSARCLAVRVVRA